MGTALLLGEKRTRRGESIAQRSQRPQRGILGAMVRAGFGWSSSLLGEKHAYRREHRTEVTEATEGDFGAMVRAGFGWSSSLLGGKHTHFGESIAQRSRRPQRGILGAMVRAGFGWSSSLLGGKHTLRREHRTEVTEVTEGDFRGDGASGLWADVVTFGRETRVSERASHRGHRGHREGILGRWCERALGGRRFWAGNTRRREHRTEVTEVTEGILPSRRRSSPSTASRKIGNYNFR